MILTPSPACFDIIKRSEGLRLTAYPDPATGGEPYTVGYGHTGSDVYPGLTISRDKADELLREDVSRFAAGVSKMIGEHPTTQHGYDTLVAFAFNVGLGNLASSTLLRKHKAGDYAGAAEEFHRWNKGAGKVMPGLVKRRAAESLLYSTP